jgi:hypothetical protein
VKRCVLRTLIGINWVFFVSEKHVFSTQNRIDLLYKPSVILQAESKYGWREKRNMC